VFARCENEYEVKIPMNYKQKSYTGNEFNQKYIVFFDKEIKIYTNTRKMSSKYDIIEYEKTENLKMQFLNNTTSLPFGIREIIYKEYKYTESTYTAEEVVEIAIKALKDKEAELGIEGIVSKELNGEFCDGYYILKCKSISVQNIAKQVEVEISNGTKNRKN
jgi:hypothetical protein